MNGRAVAAWSAACLLGVLLSTNPAYRVLVLAAVLAAVIAGAGWARSRRLLMGLGLAVATAGLLTFATNHLGGDVLFELPVAVPLAGGPWTLESLVYGTSFGLALAAAALAMAPLSLMLETHQVVD